MELVTELTDREKCMIVQMMLRQSPRLQKLPKKLLESIQLFYQRTVYPDLSPQVIGQINNDMDKFLHEAEATMQKALVGSIGANAFKSVLSKFHIGEKKSKDSTEVSQEVLKEMETVMKKEVNDDDGT